MRIQVAPICMELRVADVQPFELAMISEPTAVLCRIGGERSIEDNAPSGAVLLPVAYRQLE